MWATDKGVHVAWWAVKWLPKPNQPPQWDSGRVWLIVDTFDRDTGTLLGQNLFDPYPPSVTAKLSGLYSVGARSDGTFVVGYDWVENGERPQRAMLFHVGDDKPFANVVLPVAGDPLLIGTQLAAGWDGEAFALHAYGAPPQYTLHVARIDETGKVLLPLTQYGSIPNVSASELGSKTCTGPESGRPYVFSADTDNLLAGHDRAGAPRLVWQARRSWTPSGSRRRPRGPPALAADADGGWLGWIQTKPTGGDLVVQRINLDGDPTGNAAMGSIYPLADPKGLSRIALQSVGKGGARVYSASTTKLYLIPLDAAEWGTPSLIVDSTSTPDFDARDLSPFAWKDENWLGFWEQHAGYDTILRVLKVKPGCVYPGRRGAAQ
ncbi:MAG: hypothetical protein IPI67_29345 [Myxococcales bacterium]|nr:hypothetical protein [Myxococcales bacterium]